MYFIFPFFWQIKNLNLNTVERNKDLINAQCGGKGATLPCNDNSNNINLKLAI